MKRLGLFALALLLPSLAQAAQLAPFRWGVRGGIGATVISDRAADIASTNDALFTGELVFSFEPSRKASGLDLELGVMGMSSSATAFQTYESMLSTTSALVGARYRLPLLSWLNLYGRVNATLDWTSLTLKESDNGALLSDTAFTAGVLGAVGTEMLFTITRDDRPRTGLGLYFELGWIQRLSRAQLNQLTPEGATESDPPRIEFTPVNAGSLNLSAPIWRVGGVLRF